MPAPVLRDRIPLLIGSWGRKTLHLAGRIATEAKVVAKLVAARLPVLRANGRPIP